MGNRASLSCCAHGACKGVCTLSEATKWFRSARHGWQKELTEDGDVHPKPGPLKSVRVVSLNVGGVSGAWGAVDEFLRLVQLDVLVLQEVCASDSEVVALRRSSLRQGYRMHHLAGAPTVGAWGETRMRGGVALFVKSSLTQRPAFTFVGQHSQCVGIWLQGWFVACAYTPPGHGDEPVFELGSALVEWFASMVPLSQPWTLFGDFCAEPAACELVPCMAAFGGLPVATGLPTRCNCIDWCLTNRPHALSSLGCLMLC